MSVSLPIELICPICRAPLKVSVPYRAECEGDSSHIWLCVDGIWRMLRPERHRYFARFITEYETIRRAEGRGSAQADFYQALPYHDLSGWRPGDWRVRARSFDTLLKEVVEPVERTGGRPLTIVDLGAGNGWLSNRLAARGHQLAAVDLAVNAFDGLGAHTQYETHFMPIQAEFDALPLPDSSAELVIFNASLHYSVHIHATLVEAFRVLRPSGTIAIMDTPHYHDGQSGAAMVQERAVSFEQKYGFRSDALPIENYLTWARLTELGTSLGQTWEIHWPVPRWRWALRRLLARLRGHREPASFPIIVGHKAAAP